MTTARPAIVGFLLALGWSPHARAETGADAGHPSLYVKLAKTGGVVISGDLYHHDEERTLGRMPAEERTTATPASRRKIETVLVRKHVQLWIGHSTAFFRSAVKAPRWYD